MSKEKFNKFFIANLKRTYQIVAPAVKEKQKLQDIVEEATARIAELDAKISVLDSPIKRETGGYGVEDLIVREVIDTGKTDKDGHPIKITKLNLRYPETIVPPTGGSMCDEVIPQDNVEEPAVAEEIQGEPFRPIE
jgi:hypothetical protein